MSRLVEALRGPPRLPALTAVHTVGSVAGGLVTVSLASSIFFRLSPDASRVEVLRYLAVTMLPLAALAPLIGPLIDRFSNSARWVAALMNLGRGACCVAVAATLHTVQMYAWTLALLVSSKAYGAAKYAMIPRLAPDAEQLVAVNARLSKWSAAGGAGGLALGGLLDTVGGPPALLFTAAAGYTASAAWTTRVPRMTLPARRRYESPSPPPSGSRVVNQRARAASVTLFAVRCAVGFFTFTAMFALRRSDEPPEVSERSPLRMAPDRSSATSSRRRRVECGVRRR